MIPPLNRRDALKATTMTLLGGALAAGGTAAAGSLAACARETRPATSGALGPDDQALAEEIADTLLPTTVASPGARAAGAGAAINLLLTDCYDPAAQQRIVRGLESVRAICRDRCGGGFTKLSPSERERLLREIDAESRRAGAGNSHWFGLMRELALRAYFTSEIGMTRALRYVRVPGTWRGCIPLEPGQPAWG